jgi:ZIP family zinc transporter/zinc and cadmium transporter
MLHKLPEGFTIASVMKATGAGRRGTLGAAGLLSIATFGGVIATGLLSNVAGPALAVATGSVLYVGATDLMAEANKEFGILNPIMVFIGIGMFFALIGVARLAGVEV